MINPLAVDTPYIFLRQGDVVVASKPVLIGTILGSCIAVTMFSPGLGIGAICHAMYPADEDKKHDRDLRYVDTAIRYLHRSVSDYGPTDDLVVKLFGGSQSLAAGPKSPGTLDIGSRNVATAQEVLNQLGLTVVKSNVGGPRGRKLLFSIQNGATYLSFLVSNEVIPELMAV